MNTETWTKGLIGAVRDTQTRDIQALLSGFAARRRAEGLRVVGVIETARPAGEGEGLSLRDIVTGEEFAITQNLGKGAGACQLDPSGLAAACASVERALETGFDVLILSKFGKEEASGRGLLSCMCAAFTASVPSVIG